MKNLKKKGFTIVELVIVIAVIAVLAAVLIPTFVNLTRKANISADEQAVRHMNEILIINEATNDKPESAMEVLTILYENGYNYSMDPYYSEYTLAWLKSENRVVLVKDNAIVYPKEYTDLTSFSLFVAVENDASKLQTSIENLKPGEVLIITEDIEASNTLSFNFANEGTYGLDLSGNELTSEYAILEGSSTGGTFKNVAYISNGDVLLTNGTIIAKNGETSTCLYITDSAKVTLDNMKLDNLDEDSIGKTCMLADYNTEISTLNNCEIISSGNGIQAYESTIILNNVTVTSHNQSSNDFLNAAIGFGTDFKLSNTSVGSVTINGGTYTGKYFVSAFGSNVANNGVKHQLVINDGTFNGGIHAANYINIKIYGGTFNIDTTDTASIEIVKNSVQPGVTITINNQTYSK